MRVRKCTRPAACILSYTYTRPRKSRTECVIQKIQSHRTSEWKTPRLNTQHTEENTPLRSPPKNATVPKSAKCHPSRIHTFRVQSHKSQINRQLENQSAEDARPAACILSYTYTRPRKSRKECVIEKIHSCRMRVRKCTRPAACILSYTYTRPRKSRKECVIQKIHSRGSRERKSTRPTLHTQLHTYWTKQVTQEGSAGELEYEGDSDKHSQETNYRGYA